MNNRYVSLTDSEKQQMMQTIGVTSADQLFDDIPAELRLNRSLDLPPPLSEFDLVSRLKALAALNRSCENAVCFLGAGMYDHFIPAVVDHMISRQEFYTAYTPYQPEISQGLLQAIFEYQTMMCDLTGMDVSNASLYDGATAAAEAVLMACQATRRHKILLPDSVHPHTRQVLKTYERLGKFSLAEFSESAEALGENRQNDENSWQSNLDQDTAAVVIQSPDFFGVIKDIATAADAAHAKGAYLIVIADPLSLALLEAPGSKGADLVVGDGQVLGNPMNYGGPSLGFIAAKKKDLRRLPGRIVGQTTDKNSQRGFVLTIQTREQHIRREKATSNICSNQALNALTAAVYLSAMGPAGLKQTATLCLHKAQYAFDTLTGSGEFEPIFKDKPFFREFALTSKQPVAAINRKLLKAGVIGGLELSAYYPHLGSGWLVAVTEKRTRQEIDQMAMLACAR